MGKAQKNYFAILKSNDQIAKKQALQYSIELERGVDDEISRVNEILIQRSYNQ